MKSETDVIKSQINVQNSQRSGKCKHKQRTDIGKKVKNVLIAIKLNWLIFGHNFYVIVKIL